MVKKRSIVHGVTSVLVATMIPLIVLLTFGNLYSIGYSNRLLADSNQRIVEQWSKQIDQNLAMIERSLSSIVFVEPEFAAMSSQESELGVHLAAHVITQRLDTMMNAFPALGGLFMYSSKDVAWVERFADNAYPYSFRESIRTLIRTEEYWKNSLGRWHVQPVSGKNMLMISLKYDTAYMIALVDFERLLSVTQETYRLYYVDESGNALSGGAFSMPKKVAEQPEGCCEAVGADGENYLTVWSSLGRVPVRLLLAVSDAGY